MQAANWQRHSSPDGLDRDHGVAQGLGVFSIALGLAELLAPRVLGRALGVGERTVLLPMLGARELASGLGILSRRRKSGWLWSRVGGDAMDLALLGLALRAFPGRRNRIGLALAAVAGVALLDVWASRRMSRVEPPQPFDGETR